MLLLIFFLTFSYFFFFENQSLLKSVSVSDDKINSPVQRNQKFVTGKHESNRDLSSIRTTSGLSTNEVLSAPSSPSQFNEQSRPAYENTNIGRNPLLRGSKCNFFVCFE